MKVIILKIPSGYRLHSYFHSNKRKYLSEELYDKVVDSHSPAYFVFPRDYYGS